MVIQSAFIKWAIGDKTFLKNILKNHFNNIFQNFAKNYQEYYKNLMNKFVIKNVKEIKTKDNLKQIIERFCGEFFVEALFYFLLFTTTGLHVFVGFWALWAIFPIGACVYICSKTITLRLW